MTARRTVCQRAKSPARTPFLGAMGEVRLYSNSRENVRNRSSARLDPEKSKTLSEIELLVSA